METERDQHKQPARRVRPAQHAGLQIFQDFLTGDAPGRPVNLALFPWTVGQLSALIGDEKRRQEQTAAKFRRRHGWAEADGNERAEIRAQILARAQARRAEGRLLDTADAAVTEAVRLELVRRGVDPADPPEAPPGAGTSGRWPGTANRGASGRFNAVIPRAYATAVTAAAWQISGPIIHELRSRFPAGRPLVDPGRVEAWNSLARRVVTPGDIYREAIEHLIEAEA